MSQQGVIDQLDLFTAHARKTASQLSQRVIDKMTAASRAADSQEALALVGDARILLRKADSVLGYVEQAQYFINRRISQNEQWAKSMIDWLKKHDLEEYKL